MSADLDVIIERMPDYEIRLYRCMSSEHRQTYLTLRRRLDEYILDFLAMNIRYFTSHGKKHSLGVVRQLSHMLPEATLATMTSVEMLILLCSAWLHDIGLLVNRDSSGKPLNDKEIRDRHHELSRERIMEIHVEAGIDNANLTRLIADVCLCHRRSVSIEERLAETRGIRGQLVRPRLLAALLRLGDALDTDSQRAPLVLLEKLTTLPDLDGLHWRACQMLEISYLPEQKAIRLDAAYNPKSDLTGEDEARQLFLWKFNDLCDEFEGVRELLQGYGLPYTRLIGNLEYYEAGRLQVCSDEPLPEEVLPLEIILYQRQRETYRDQEQFLFASYWDYQAARLYEERAQDGSQHSTERALQRAREFYQSALGLIREEIPRQPPERYYLRTLERFYALKLVEIDDCLKDTASLSLAERVFLRHMSMVQCALPRAGLRTKLQIGTPWSELDEENKMDFERVLREDVKNPDWAGRHFRCCSCVAERVLWMIAAQCDKEASILLQWLNEREEGQWRTLGNLKTERDTPRSFLYTAETLHAFTEFESSSTPDDRDLLTADKIANVLTNNRSQWLENHETPTRDVLADILTHLALYLRRCGKNFGVPPFSQLLKKDQVLCNLVKELTGLAGPERVEGIRGLILWREIPKDVLYQCDAALRSLSLQQHVKSLVCQAIQKDIIHDPLWQDSDPTRADNAGKWLYNTERKIETLLSFWEYYLQGDDLQAFPQLAGISQEKEQKS
jgi:hypothetical protein